ncbi:uncharacterized protein LOC125038550 [Penaeus chinensis]|uniref:uncharacterized protein LOC125038550 n=1 Tax=Penaeus chinensis TaxID=139456 RepID=UPI001FB79B52|nr:uncharacterized protein LOC125038550 [Penaeus chinensis]XP_047488025.1 uncharacterized protein LOC125038550 [Penaeus chinensis]
MTSRYLIVALVWVATGAVTNGTPHSLEPSFVGHVNSAPTAFREALGSHSKVQAKREVQSLEPVLGVTDVSLWPRIEGNVVKRSAYSGYSCPPRGTVTRPVYIEKTVIRTVYPNIILPPCRCDTCSYSPSSNFCTCLPVAGCGSVPL